MRSLLAENPGYEVVGEAEDGMTATQLAETLARRLDTNRVFLYNGDRSSESERPSQNFSESGRSSVVES